jgi:hypothetical protein
MPSTLPFLEAGILLPKNRITRVQSRRIGLLAGADSFLHSAIGCQHPLNTWAVIEQTQEFC